MDTITDATYTTDSFDPLNASISILNSSISTSSYDYSSTGGTPSMAASTAPAVLSCKTYELALSVILVSITGTLGLAGNVLTLTVLHYSRNHTVTVFLLNALAISDLIFIVFCMVLVAVPAYCSASADCAPVLMNVISHVELYGWSVASMAHTINVYITVLVTVHRYIIVCCSPHIAARISTHKQARRQLAVIVICGILYNIPRFFEYTYVDGNHLSNTLKGNQSSNRNFSYEPVDQFAPSFDVPLPTIDATFPPPTEETVYVVHRQLNAFGRNVWYQIIYRNVCYCVFIFIIPFSILITLSYKLAKVVKSRLEYRKNMFMPQRKGKEDNTTFVLIVIVAIFLVCQMPTLFQRVFYFILVDDNVKCGEFFFYFSRFTDYLVIVNCSVNFIVYILFARQFRETLWSILCSCMSKGERESQVVLASVPLK